MTQATGGLFNPELADHDVVRDLLLDARTALNPGVNDLSEHGNG
jgi:hypothetical protein